METSGHEEDILMDFARESSVNGDLLDEAVEEYLSSLLLVILETPCIQFNNLITFC